MTDKNTYKNLSTPPQDALKQISFGALKGMSDINPQWRYEALTKEFGLCGEGWRFEVANTFTEKIESTGEKMLFVQVNLYVKIGESWSEPIPGFGGDYIIKKDKNGIHGNDEAYKMATTDALGTAAKMIGVAADVYRGIIDTKYGRRQQQDDYLTQQKSANQKQPQHNEKAEAISGIMRKAKELGMSNKDIQYFMRMKFNVESSDKMTLGQAKALQNNLEKWWEEESSAKQSQK